MKVLLVSFYNEEAYGVRSIHSSLIECGIDAYMLFFKIESKFLHSSHNENVKKDFMGIINNASEKEIDLLYDFMIFNNFDVVGFSLVSSHFNLYKKIYNRIKHVNGIKIVLGGWQPTLNPSECIGYCDALCIGEGEHAFCEFVNVLNHNESVDGIKNFWINKHNESIIIKNEVRPLVNNISAFPTPLYNNKYSYYIEDDKLVNRELYFDNVRYGTFVGTGCPKHCTYCSNSYMVNNVYPKSWSKIRYRGIYHVRKEFIEVKNKMLNIKSINFYDEVFTPDMQWISDFFSWYKKEINIPFYCFFFPGSCNDEKCKILSESGMVGVWIGVQSGSLRVRNEIFKRYYTNQQVIDQGKIFNKYGVKVRYDFIFDNPFESFDESIESILLMLDLPVPYTLNLFSLKFFPNTEITQMALDKNIINKSNLNDNQINDQDNYLIGMDTNKNKDNKFINLLAFYISNKCNDVNFYNENILILNLINDYKKNKNIENIEKLTKGMMK